jgi:DNA-binding LytR/AlgR family response regulator
MVKAVSRYTSSCVTFEDGNDMWRGEIRQCAIVFLDVHMMSCDDRNSFTLASAVAAMEVTQTVLKQTGGTLRQFLVDDKGSVVIVVFGLPAMAHSDDSTRAVTFALETIKKLKKKKACQTPKPGFVSVTFSAALSVRQRGANTQCTATS